MIQNIKKSKIFFDIGANLGYYSLIAAKVMDNEGEIVAFEPSKRNYEILVKDLELNNAVQVRAINAAIFDHDGRVYLKEGNHGGLDKIDTNAGSYQIDCVKLDNWCFRNGTYPDIMKIDVEGAETFVLEGAREIIEKYKPIIFLSTHGPDTEKKSLEFLEKFGYSFEKIEDNEYICSFIGFKIFSAVNDNKSPSTVNGKARKILNKNLLN